MKSNACGFNVTAYRLIHNYLTNRKQGTRINSVCILCEEIFPPGLIVGPFLWNIFLCNFFFIVVDLFFVLNDIGFASKTNDKAPYTFRTYTNEPLSELEIASEKLF